MPAWEDFFVKTQIYLVRHCESEGNACRRNHAQFDGFVTRKGLAQAEALTKRFENIPVTAIYSSDSYRSRMTAAPLAERKGLSIKYRMLLREYTIGCWEGTSIGNTALAYPDLWHTWITAPYAHQIPGADNFEIVADRGVEIIRRMANENPGGIVVAVTHSCTLYCTLTKLLGQPISYYTQIKSGDNTAVTLVEVDEAGKMDVIFINDDSHLPKELLRACYTGRSAETNFAFDVAKETQQWTIVPRLIDVPHGKAVVKRHTAFGGEYGELISLFVDEDLRFKGYIEQLFGEVIESLRYDGVRYILAKKQDEVHFNYLFDRFCFEEFAADPSYLVVRVTVPGLEGPVY